MNTNYYCRYDELSARVNINGMKGKRTQAHTHDGCEIRIKQKRRENKDNDESTKHMHMSFLINNI